MLVHPRHNNSSSLPISTWLLDEQHNTLFRWCIFYYQSIFIYRAAVVATTPFQEFMLLPPIIPINFHLLKLINLRNQNDQKSCAMLFWQLTTIRKADTEKMLVTAFKEIMNVVWVVGWGEDKRAHNDAIACDMKMTIQSVQGNLTDNIGELS